MEGAGMVAEATMVAAAIMAAVATGVAEATMAVAAIMAAATMVVGAGAASAGASQPGWHTVAITPHMLTTMDTITATQVSAILRDIGSSIAMANAC
jgi:hypothetical protein